MHIFFSADPVRALVLSGMKLPQHRMVQFMSTHFETPFRTVKRVGNGIIESAKRPHSRRRVCDMGYESNDLGSSQRFPMVLQTGLVEEHHSQIFDFMPLYIGPGRDTAKKAGQAQPNEEPADSTPPPPHGPTVSVASAPNESHSTGWRNGYTLGLRPCHILEA